MGGVGGWLGGASSQIQNNSLSNKAPTRVMNCSLSLSGISAMQCLHHNFSYRSASEQMIVPCLLPMRNYCPPPAHPTTTATIPLHTTYYYILHATCYILRLPLPLPLPLLLQTGNTATAPPLLLLGRMLFLIQAPRSALAIPGAQREAHRAALSPSSQRLRRVRGQGQGCPTPTARTVSRSRMSSADGVKTHNRHSVHANIDSR